MTLASWLLYLETLPSGLTNRSLTKTKKLAKKLGVLDFLEKIIIVGGTNGKGSCVIFLESIFLASGYKTGAYISPHILRYNERIRINGKDINNKSLCKAFAKIKLAKENNTLSYFEYTTLAALIIFKQHKLDILILEVGLGGKFDAVNILEPDISVITTISFDHTKVLGKTREKIGYQKAGIMRPLKPTICTDQFIPKSIYKYSDKINAHLYCLNQSFWYTKKDNYWNYRGITNAGKYNLNKLPIPKLPINSAASALMVIQLLKNQFNFTIKNIKKGIENAFIPARLQSKKIGKTTVIFDVAHNQESAELLAQNLANYKKNGRIFAVVSMLADKNIAATLKPLVKIVNKWYIGKLSCSRAASVDKLKKSLIDSGGKNIIYMPSISKGLKQAIAECKGKDKIVVFGSFRTVGEGIKTIQQIKIHKIFNGKNLHQE